MVRKAKQFLNRLLLSGLLITALYCASARTNLGKDLLCGAAYGGGCWEIRLLVIAGADPNHVGWEDHFTPLGNAVRGGQIKAARLLLELGADPNVPDDFGHTAVAAEKIYSDADPASKARVAALLRQSGGH